MAGTFLFTGANGSLAIPAIQYLLEHYDSHTLLLTVRNASNEDINTNRLRSMLAQRPSAKFSIRQLDLANLSAVHEFANNVTAEIGDGRLPPLFSIICNAYYWNLNSTPAFTSDGYEKTIQVNHVAHAALILRLVGSFHATSGRIVLFSSDAHWPGKNGLEKYPPAIPNDLDLLVKPETDQPSDNFGHGFQRYATSKLAVVMWMYALNRYLEKEPKLNNITAVAINPGNLSDSRALRTNTPSMLYYMSIFIIRPLRPLLRFMDPTMRTAAEAGVDVVDLATSKVHPGVHGYFTLLNADVSAPDSMDEKTQEMLWVKSLEWARITRENTSLTTAFE